MSLLVFLKYYIQISKSNIFSTINEESDISSLGVDHATIFFYNSFLVRNLMASSLLCYINNMVANHMAENCIFLGGIFVFLCLVPGPTCLRHFTCSDHKQLSPTSKISGSPVQGRQTLHCWIKIRSKGSGNKVS